MPTRNTRQVHRITCHRFASAVITLLGLTGIVCVNEDLLLASYKSRCTLQLGSAKGSACQEMLQCEISLRRDLNVDGTRRKPFDGGKLIDGSERLVMLGRDVHCCAFAVRVLGVLHCF